MEFKPVVPGHTTCKGVESDLDLGRVLTGALSPHGSCSLEACSVCCLAADSPCANCSEEHGRSRAGVQCKGSEQGTHRGLNPSGSVIQVTCLTSG